MLVHLLLPCLFLFLSVYSNKVSELGLLPPFANLNNDPHDNILETVFAVSLRISYAVYLTLGQVHDIVTGEFAFLFQDLVLINEQALSKGLILVLLNKLLHLFMSELEKLRIGQTPEVNIGVILHKEGAMIDR